MILPRGCKLIRIVRGKGEAKNGKRATGQPKRIVASALGERGSRDTVVACGAWVVTSVDSGVKPGGE